jgi:tRNA-guanine family transglycosylase
VRTAIGEMYLRLDDEPEARRVFSEIVEFAPQDELARRRLGDLYRAHGWFEDAYRQYQTLATIRPDDPDPLEPGCGCPTCARWSRAYLRHLLMVNEPTVARLTTLHNVHWLLRLMERVRDAVAAGTLATVRAEVAAAWS